MKTHIDQIDLEAGKRLKAVRNVRGLSQQTLAEALGITFQQVQKYENGTNRISVSRLVRMCEYLKCSINDIVCAEDSGSLDLHKELQELRKFKLDILAVVKGSLKK